MSDDWYDHGFDEMIQYISEASGVSVEQAREVYSVMFNLGLIDYDTEKEVIWEQFCD